MKWFKNLFRNNDEEVEDNDLNAKEEWNAFSSKKIDSNQEETVNVQRGFKFPMISDEEFSKRSMIGSVSAYDNSYDAQIPNQNENEIYFNETIHNETVQPARERRRTRRFAEENQLNSNNRSSERRTRRHIEETASPTFSHFSERRTRTRERIDNNPQPIVNEPIVTIRKPRQPEVITNPIPKSPFKLTEVPSPVFGFKDRNVESVNPNTIVEKYGKQDNEMDQLKSRVARRNELLKEQEEKLANTMVEPINSVPNKVVNGQFEEDLAIIVEQGFDFIQPEVKAETTSLQGLTNTEEKVEASTVIDDSLEEVVEVQTTEADQLEEVLEVQNEKINVDEVSHTYIEDTTELEEIEEADIEAQSHEQLIVAEEADILTDEQEIKPVFEYCDDCDENEEVEVFGVQEEVVEKEATELKVEASEESEAIQLEEIHKEETKPVFEYCEDCDEEEVEVFGVQKEVVEEEATESKVEASEEQEAIQLEEINTNEQISDDLANAHSELALGEKEVAATTMEADSLEEEQSEPIAKPQVRRKVRPFNVLMTKYDKDRWEEQVKREKLASPTNSEQTAELEEPNAVLEENVELEETNAISTNEEHETEGNNNSSITEDEEVIEEEPKAKRKIRPFNVLMTKYDKERWQQQLKREKLASSTISEQTAKLEETINVPVKEEMIMEEDIHFYDEELDEELDPTLEELDADYIDLEHTDVEEQVEEVIEEIEEPPYYAFPSIDLLNEPIVYEENEEWLNEREEMLNATFASFNIGAKVVHRTQGPSVTRFEVQLEPGVKVNKITNLSDDIQLGLAARDIRIEAPIPGKHTVGIEVPNDSGRPVRISEIINTPEFKDSKSPLTSVLGLDIEGKPIVTDLKKMPHGLIAGATGSGKSVCINSILVSLLYKADPTDVKLILIDPKMVELAPYNNIPHLVSPVITDVKAATAALKWAVEEMERRYQLFAHTGVREIGRYNELVMESKQYNQKLPYIVVVIDELADLMMVAASDVEDAICRIAQKARACGIHLIIATQRPSVDVITGLIKANVPTRIAFSVSSQIDSRTIIDISGAEKLLGRGDMLFLENGSNKAVRLQGTYVTDEEIEAIVNHCKNERQVEYLFQQEDLLKKVEVTEEEDELFLEACHFVVEHQAASASMLQRKYKIGYNRAARLIDMMESYGYISENRGSKPREVLITLSDLDK